MVLVYILILVPSELIMKKSEEENLLKLSDFKIKFEDIIFINTIEELDEILPIIIQQTHVKFYYNK